MGDKSDAIAELKVPVANDSLLTNKEKIVLLRSSKLRGCIFPPWKGPPSNEEFVEPYTDAAELRLSEEQSDALHAWQSLPRERLGLDTWCSTDVDLVQDVTTDCSVVASLCAENARRQKLDNKSQSLFRGSINPANEVSKNGKYVLKLHFNGCWRKVVIDDRLPCSRSDRSLHVVDRSNSMNILPALLEKAYLKVRGGYDFPGSNSGTDLWTLTGWIPEQLFLQSEDIVPSVFWKRIYNAFNYGDVLITLGTDNLTREEEDVLGLAGGHAYAVIDLKEQDGCQLFLIKNPWSKGGTWTGYIDPSNPSIRSQPEQPRDLDSRMFWMDLYNVIQYFHTIYLNWNPGLFGFRRDVHFSWDISVFSPSKSLTKNPQYLLKSTKGGTIFLILTRHFQNSDIDFASGDSGRATSGYLGLSAFETETRLVIKRRALHQSNYIDAPNILLRFDLLPSKPYVVVVFEQELPRQETSFTLSAFSTHELSTLCPAQERYDYNVSIEGTWTEESARGNVGNGDFDRNPQYSLTVTESSDIAILLECNDPNYAIQVKLVWSGGKRIQLPLITKDIYGDSGGYTQGCALAEIRNVLAGTYTIVCSTFEAGQTGKFDLRISSTNSNYSIKPIAHEDAGMLMQHLPRATFRPGVDRRLAPIEVSRNTRLRFNMQNLAASTQSSASLSPFKLSVEFGQGPNKTVLTTGDFANKQQIRSSTVDISPRTSQRNGPGVWLVVERAGGAYTSHSEDVQVDLLSDVPGVSVGAWGQASDVPIEQLRDQLAGTAISRR